HSVYKMGQNRVHPLTIPKTMANAGASHISMEFGITGPSYTISTACSSASHAIGQAFWMVRSGAAPLAVTGGSEAPFSFGILKAWEALRVVSPDTCRPFSKDRNGMVLGEGAAMLILEPLEAARALEALAAIVALRDGFLPPTVNYTVPDPACDLDVVPNTAREADIEYALSNSFAFGGLNAVLAFRK